MQDIYPEIKIPAKFVANFERINNLKEGSINFVDRKI
jgi:hypothetical protein